MSIRKLAENKYEVRFSKRHPSTRKSLSIKRQAKTFASAKRLELQLPVIWEEKFNPKNNDQTKFITVLSRYYSELEERHKNGELSKASMENRKLMLDAHALPLWRTREIGSISTDEIRTLVRDTLSHLAIPTRQDIRKFLNGLFRYAVEARYLRENPVPVIHWGRDVDKIKGVLNEQQLRILLENAMVYHKDTWYPIWAAGIYTGCRTSELKALTWDKVDLERRTIHVTAAEDKKNGFRDLVKNGQDRIAEIAPPLIPILQALKIRNPNSIYVLPRVPEWMAGREAEFLRMFLRSINLPPVRFHDLRASWCTACLSHGVPMVKVMAMGGWKDLKTMQRYFRKAGLTIKGMTDSLAFHDPTPVVAPVIPLKSSGES